MNEHLGDKNKPEQRRADYSNVRIDESRFAGPALHMLLRRAEIIANDYSDRLPREQITPDELIPLDLDGVEKPSDN